MRSQWSSWLPWGPTTDGIWRILQAWKKTNIVDLTKKGQKFLWTEACDRAFESMKKALVSTDVMGYPVNQGGDFILNVDVEVLVEFSTRYRNAAKEW